jgi:hypothetical protein
MAAAADILQPELLLNEQASPDMRFAARLIAQMQREFSQKRRHMLRIVGQWLTAFDYVKMLEEEHLAASAPLQPQTEFLSGTVALVKGLGILLLAHLQSADVDRLDGFGLTYADLAACVQELEDIDRALHSDLTPAMIGQMNSVLFGGESPRQ